MSTHYTERSDFGTNYGSTRSQSNDLNMGSARSDYGKYAYGGDLDKRGMDKFRDRGLRSFRRGGSRSHWWGKGLMALGGTVVGAGLGVAVGAGIGAAAMYMLDPDKGRDRRTTARHKLNDASHKASELIGKRSHDLRERAQGMIAGARKRSNIDDGASDATIRRSSVTISGASGVERSTGGMQGSGGRTVTS